MKKTKFNLISNGLRGLIFLLISLWGGLAIAIPSQYMFVGEADVWWANPQTANTISVLKLDYPSGNLTSVQQLSQLTNQPSWLLFNDKRNLLYSANADGSGIISSFQVDPQTRELTFKNNGPSGGVVPVYLVMDAEEKFLLSANYDSGTISAVALQVDGSIGNITAHISTASSFAAELPGLDANRQASSHPHMVALDPQKKFVWVADLGLDRLISYQFDSATGQFNLVQSNSYKLTHNDKEGNPIAVGPRHFVFDNKGKHLYVANELDNTVSVLNYHRGKLQEIQHLSLLPESTLPADCPAPAAAEIVIDKKGKFIYVSNRLDCPQHPAVNKEFNSIAIFAINKSDGTLSKKTIQSAGVIYPRNFNIDPTGKFLYVGGELSNDIRAFHVKKDGSLMPAKHEPIPVHAPSCIIFSDSVF
jgi:6-phosphogluconolactonase